MFDAIIVGAGPAGATLARELAINGVSCLLLEKEHLPRYKTCAGGVSIRAARLLDFDISSVVERTISGASLGYKFLRKHKRCAVSPIIYVTCRDRLDRLLVEEAEKAGAKLLEGEKVVAVERLNLGLRIKTAGGDFDSQVLVGADGANSTIARELGLNSGFFYGLGLQAEVYVSSQSLERWTDTLDLDLGTIPGGYGWCFPKNDHLSIGAAGYLPFVKKLKPYLDRLIDNYCPDGFKSRKVHGAPVRIRHNSNSAITSNGALLIGEAAGLVNAFTGEGIYYAIKSAQIAAVEIVKYLKGEVKDFRGYSGAVDRELMPELGLSYTIARTAITGGIGASRLFFDAFVSNMTLWGLASSALSGEITYKEFRENHKSLHPLLRLMRG